MWRTDDGEEGRAGEETGSPAKGQYCDLGERWWW